MTQEFDRRAIARVEDLLRRAHRARPVPALAEDWTWDVLRTVRGIGASQAGTEAWPMIGRRFICAVAVPVAVLLVYGGGALTLIESELAGAWSAGLLDTWTGLW